MRMEFCMVLAVVSTGIMAGIFFTWTNAVTPGIGTLDDLSYLTAFKSMNRSILNPLFFIVFFLPVCIIPLLIFLKYQDAGSIEWNVLFISGLIYIVGCFLTTIMGNVPLNEMLEKSSVETFTIQELNQLRTKIEMRWNMFNLIRTCSSFISFILLVLFLCINK